jgi:hypothetical protein
MILDVETIPDDGRPLLLMDVDGVLNAINRNQGSRTYAIHQVLGYPIRFRHEMANWLARLAEHFTPVWCTMWDDQANEYLTPLLGLPRLPYVPCDAGRYNLGTWNGRYLHSKVGCIAEHVGERPFAWIDDEIGSGDLAWAAARDDEIAPTYLLKIDQRMGLLEHHVNKLVGWATLIR